MLTNLFQSLCGLQKYHWQTPVLRWYITPRVYYVFPDLALCDNLTLSEFFFLSSERHIPKAQNIEVQCGFPCCLSKIQHPQITKCEKQNSKCRHFSFLLSIIYFPSKIACTTITTFLTPDSISLCSKGATKPKRNLSLLLTFYPKNLSDIFWTA